MLCALLLAASLLVGCAPQGAAQPEATPTPEAATPIPAATTSVSTATEVAGTPPPATTPVEGTPTPRPTPGGEPPKDPLDVLNIFDFFSSQGTLVKRDTLNLDAKDAPEVLFTVVGPSAVITGESESILGVLLYDSVYREWNFIWQSTPITGTASPLPAANRSFAGGYNGGDILRTGSPVLAMRTTTLDGKAHLHLWKWNAAEKSASYLRMVSAGGGAERDAIFDAELDLNVIDLNNDGIYEVVADNLSGVQVWKWDGSKFVPEEASR
jgi:hypothetical protein